MITYRSLPDMDDSPSPLAGQSFNVKGFKEFPGWISGLMEFPPKSKKEPECVWWCTQVKQDDKPRDINIQCHFFPNL